MKQGRFDFATLVRNPGCTACPLHKSTEHVCLLGKGPKHAKIMIVGEAPGRDETPHNEPFRNRVGAMIDELLEENGFTRDEVYMCNAVSCRPPEQRTPTKREIKACNTWLMGQIEQVRPKFVVLLGNTPLISVTGKPGIKSLRGKPFEKDGIVYLPMYHPNFILRDESFKWTIESDFKLLRTLVDGGGLPREQNLNSKWVRTWDDFKKMKKNLRGTISFDIETSCLYPWDEKAEVKMIGFGTSDTQWSILFNHELSPWSKEDQRKIIAELTPILEDRCFVVTANGKFDFLWMWVHYDVRWHEELYNFDTQIAHYLIDENSLHGLKFLAQKYCGAPDWDVDKTTKTMGADIEKGRIYHAHDLYYTRELRFKLGRLLHKDGDVKRVFEHLMMPIARLFVEVEYDGVCVDHTKFDAAQEYLQKEIDESLGDLKKYEPKELTYTHKKTGEVLTQFFTKDDPFNWASVDQLKRLLFGKKGWGGFALAPLDRTEKGEPSTSESVLKRLEHPSTQALMRYRGAKQQMSFFIEGWKPFLHWKNGVAYLHPSFKLTGTVTGRPSCEHPNLQQVPRDERIRSLITAPPGWVLIECDLSQIELRIASELAGEREMLKAFNTGVDVHWLTAIREIGRGGGLPKEVVNTAWEYLKRTNKKAEKPTYKKSLSVLLEMGPDTAVEIDKGWKELRKKAKAINFGYLYGMWWKKFKDYARDNYGVTVTDKEAEASRTGFFDTYADFPDWHTRQKRYARRHGYVRTLTGRKRRLPDAQIEWRGKKDEKFLKSKQQQAERQAINSPVQGFAAELNLMVAVQLREEFSRKEMRIVGTVHDAILMWARVDKAEEVYTRTLEIMRKPKLFKKFDIKLKVPVEGEGKIGAWSQGVDLNKWLKAQQASYDEMTGRKKQDDRRKTKVKTFA